MHNSHKLWRHSLALLLGAAMLATIPWWAPRALAAAASPATTSATQSAAVPAITTTGAAAPAATASTVADAARTQVGARFTPGGTSPEAGFDSAGLAQWAYAQAGTTIPATAAQQIQLGASASKDAMQPGDLLFFDADGNGTADWTAVYLNAGQFAVAVNPGGVVERNLRWSWYSTHLVGVRRLSDGTGRTPTPAPANPSASAADVAAAAKGQLGARFAAGGADPQTGFDSAGLAQWAFAQAGVTVPATAAEQIQLGASVSKDAMQPGDLLFFDADGNGTADWTGVYLDAGQFAVAVSPGGVVERNLRWTWYGTHLLGVRRLLATAGQTPAPSPLPTPANDFGQRVIDQARQYMGLPYVFGAEGPNSFDCSGLVQTTFRQVGVRLPRTSAQQSRVGQAVSKADLQPGDLVFFRNTYTTSGIDHVGIYMGDGKFINAWPSDGVTISDLTRPYFTSHFAGARRVK